MLMRSPVPPQDANAALHRHFRGPATANWHTSAHNTGSRTLFRLQVPSRCGFVVRQPYLLSRPPPENPGSHRPNRSTRRPQPHILASIEDSRNRALVVCTHSIGWAIESWKIIGNTDLIGDHRD